MQSSPRSRIRHVWVVSGALPFLAVAVLFLCHSGQAAARAARQATSSEASVCSLIAESAQAQQLPVTFLTRLIWQESSFHSDAVSPVGAQGIAQFMPATAAVRGLADPFDPRDAIPKAAELLASLKKRFGNLGLAAAAYNAGAARIAKWLAGHGDLPAETQRYVSIVTRHPVRDWIDRAEAPSMSEDPASLSACLKAASAIRRAQPAAVSTSAFLAPWGVQLAGSFSKAAALAAYERAKNRYFNILGHVRPLILKSRTIGLGFRSYYRIRTPAPTRAAANSLCRQIERQGGACAVLRN